MEIEKRIAKIPQQLNQFFGEFLKPYAKGDGFLENRLEKISQEIRKGIISLCIEMVWIESSLKETFSKNLMLKTSPYVERIVSIMDDWETSDLNLDLRLRKAFLLFLTLQFDPTVN